MYTAIATIIVLDRPCVQFSTVFWCTQPSQQYLFWTDRVLSWALCSDAHSHHINICSGQTVCSVQHCALMYTAIISVFVLDRPCVQFSIVLWCTQPSHLCLFWIDGVFSSALCSDIHNHHISICSVETVCSVQHLALMYKAITSVFVLERPVFRSALCSDVHGHHFSIFFWTDRVFS